MKQDYLETSGYTEQQLLDLMNLGIALKACVRAGYYPPLLKKRTVALLMPGDDPYLGFTFETAVHQLGGNAQHLSIPLEQAGAMRELGENLSRLCDLAVASCARHETLLLLAKYGEIPLINSGSDHSLPLQELADLITMFEHLPQEKKLVECRLVFSGHNTPLCRSCLYVATKIGMQFVQYCTEKSGELPPPILKIAERNVKKSGGTYAVADNPLEAFRGGDFLIMEAPMGAKLPEGAEGILRVDPLENRLTAARALLTFLLYQNPASREPILIEKMKRTLSIKLQAIFGYGETSD